MRTVRDFLEYFQMPQDCIDALCAVERQVLARAEREFSAALDYYMNGDADRPTAKVLLKALSERAQTDPRQSDMLVVLTAFTLLEGKYERLGLPHEWYENACRDAHCKLVESKNVHGVWGTEAAGWFLRFFVPSRFAFGRLQFETSILKSPGVEKVIFDFPDGKHREVCDGETIIRIHIPSTGEPLTDALRMDAYKKAHAFYKDRYEGGLVPFSCKSWLLYDKHAELLPESSNILHFQRDFCLLPCPYDDVYGDLWRIFGVPNETPFEKLPEDTSLRRIYKKHLLQGGTPGECVGLFFFDGEKIYNEPTNIVKKPLE